MAATFANTFKMSFKKRTLIFVVGFVFILCLSCKGKSFEQSASLKPFYSSNSHNSISDPISVSSSDAAEAYKMGKNLLKEYDVQYNQTIRFPFKEYVFQCHGAYALTSLKDVHSKHPDWVVPEKLEDYQFVDLTIYRDRTSVVFPNVVPRPKDTIEVLRDSEPLQYFLCYKKGSTQFRIDVLPLTKDRFEREDIRSVTDGLIPWSSHPRAYIIPEEENSTSLIRALWISPEPDGQYAFYIHKVSGSDCLESEDTTFTDKEAASIYQAIENDFPKTPPCNKAIR